MGSSALVGLMNNVTVIYNVNPNSMLDVGIGFGRYGYLARETLDFRVDSQGNFQPFQRRIDGIEIFPNYITKIHNEIYDNIYIGDAFDIISESDFVYDLIFISDVIEHFTKDRAKQLIVNALKKCKVLYINTPYVYYHQDIIKGNENENHLSGWNINDFKELGAKYVYLNEIFVCAIFTDVDLPFPLAENQIDNYSEKDKVNFILLIDKYLKTSQFEECIKECEYYIANYPENYVVELPYAILCERSGDIEKARKHAEIALRLNPKSVRAKELLERCAKNT